jgi:hypothetical protein|uniref:Predicted gene, 47429 n=1 Tax=Mus musculus TaxID=10090 RepID=A0A286YCQ8_MOUSE
MGRTGDIIKKASIKSGEPICLRKALVNNIGEEKRVKLQIQKLEKALAIRFTEMEREKATLKMFLVKLHKTTGYFPQSELW